MNCVQSRATFVGHKLGLKGLAFKWVDEKNAKLFSFEIPNPNAVLKWNVLTKELRGSKQRATIAPGEPVDTSDPRSECVVSVTDEEQAEVRKYLEELKKNPPKEKKATKEKTPRG